MYCERRAPRVRVGPPREEWRAHLTEREALVDVGVLERVELGSASAGALHDERRAKRTSDARMPVGPYVT